jgi:2-oxoglutarate ferredoxin oxidoreductase subunit gamma
MIPIFPLKVFKDIDRSAEINTGHLESKADAKRPAAPELEIKAPPVLGSVATGELKEVALTLSGFGGQGVLFAGLALAEGGVKEDLEVSWIPSYGPEMRGGTAHCHLRLSRSPIASPWISRPSSLMAFNQPSIEKFAHELLPGGLLFVNSSMVQDLPDRSDIRIIRVPAYEAAADIGKPKAANMVMLGAYLEVTRAVNQESILSAFAEHGIKPEMLQSNREAIEKGRLLVER